MAKQSPMTCFSTYEAFIDTFYVSNLSLLSGYSGLSRFCNRELVPIENDRLCTLSTIYFSIMTHFSTHAIPEAENRNLEIIAPLELVQILTVCRINSRCLF
jgi:hypothetical protein